MSRDPLELFRYQKPNENQVQRIELVRQACRGAAASLLTCCPEGADRDEAVQLLRKGMMLGTASIVFEAESKPVPAIIPNVARYVIVEKGTRVRPSAFPGSYASRGTAEFAMSRETSPSVQETLEVIAL